MLTDNARYKIVFSTKAEMEIVEAWYWYENQKTGLGDEFENKVVECVNRIAANPLYYSVKAIGYREAKIKRFPFVMIYRIGDKENLVRNLPVFHTARNPHEK